MVIASMVPRSDVAYLVGSDARPALLSACSESEVRPRDLVTDCDVSRATVHRALNGFLERGWIETTESCYSTTPFGESVLDQYDRLLDAVDRANEFGPWYQEIDASDEELPVQAVCNGSVVTATSADPTAPLEFVSTVVSTTETSRIRICTPTHARFVEVAVERIADTDGTLEIVVSEGCSPSVRIASTTSVPSQELRFTRRTKGCRAGSSFSRRQCSFSASTTPIGSLPQSRRTRRIYEAGRWTFSSQLPPGARRQCDTSRRIRPGLPSRRRQWSVPRSRVTKVAPLPTDANRSGRVAPTHS